MSKQEVAGFIVMVSFILFIGYVLFGNTTVYSYKSSDTTIFFDFDYKNFIKDTGVYTIFTLSFMGDVIVDNNMYSFSIESITINETTYNVMDRSLTYSGSALPDKITIANNILSLTYTQTPLVLSPTVQLSFIVIGVAGIIIGSISIIYGILSDFNDAESNIISIAVGIIGMISGVLLLFI